MADVLYMDAVITPNRSLSRRGFIVLISMVTALNVAAAIVFVAMDAHLVPVFMGLDVIAVIAAFAANYAAARQVERVQVSAGAVRVVHETPKWQAVVWESPTAFTRVNIDKDEEDGRVTACRLALSGRERDVAAALSPRERAEFAKALETAIWRARRGG